MIVEDDISDKEIRKLLIQLYDAVRGAGEGECEHVFWYDDCPNTLCEEKLLQEEYLLPLLRAGSYIRKR